MGAWIPYGFWLLCSASRSRALRRGFLDTAGHGKGTRALLMLQQFQGHMQNQLNEMARTLDVKLGESTRLMQGQFSESTKIIREITKELAQVGEGQKQIMSVTDQLKSVQDILKNPKHRGVLGEYY